MKPMVNKPAIRPYFWRVGWLAMITSHFNFVDKSPLPHENGYIMRSKCLSKINLFPDEDNLPKIDIICRRTKMSKQQRSKQSLWIFPCFKVCWCTPRKVGKKHFWRAMAFLEASVTMVGIGIDHWKYTKNHKMPVYDCDSEWVCLKSRTARNTQTPWQWFILEGNHWF